MERKGKERKACGVRSCGCRKEGKVDETWRGPLYLEGTTLKTTMLPEREREDAHMIETEMNGFNTVEVGCSLEVEGVEKYPSFGVVSSTHIAA